MNSDVSVRFAQNPSPVVSGENARRLLALWLGGYRRTFRIPSEVLGAVQSALNEDRRLPAFLLGTTRNWQLASLSVAFQQLPAVPAMDCVDDVSAVIPQLFGVELRYVDDSEPDDFPTLTDSERVLIGEWFQEHHAALLRVAGRYFHSKGVAFGAIAYASEYAVSECYLYACEQVARESLPVDSLAELKRWCGILASVRGRYFDYVSVIKQDPKNSTGLESIVVRSAGDYSEELTSEELDYILGIDDTTPEWILDTIAILLAMPDSTDEERAESLGISHGAFRKRLERTRNYFATRG